MNRHLTHSSIATLRELARLLVSRNLTAEGLIAHIGARIKNETLAPDMPIPLHSSLPGVRTAKLGLGRGTALPLFVALEFSGDAAPSVRELVSAFGKYRRALSDRGMPATLMFEGAARGTDGTALLIAELPDDGVPDDDAPVSVVSLRLDRA